MREPLPTFRYHPDPVATGSVRDSDQVCVVCGRARGAIYTGPVFAIEDLEDQICPWCIADGSAAARHDTQFTDVGSGVPDDVAPAVLVEISQRTPGFTGWQQEQWRYHCGDGAAFVGVVGTAEIEALPGAREAFLDQLATEGTSSADAAAILAGLDADGSPSGYAFRCLHCNRYLVSWDCD